MKRYGEGNQETFGFLFSSESDKERGRGKGSGDWVDTPLSQGSWPCQSKACGQFNVAFTSSTIFQPFLEGQDSLLDMPTVHSQSPHTAAQQQEHWDTLLCARSHPVHPVSSIARPASTISSTATCVHLSPPPLSLHSSPLRHSRPLKEQFTAQFMDLLALSA